MLVSPASAEPSCSVKQLHMGAWLPRRRLTVHRVELSSAVRIPPLFISVPPASHPSLHSPETSTTTTSSQHCPGLPGGADRPHPAELVPQHQLVWGAVQHAAPADGSLPADVQGHHPRHRGHRPVTHAGLLPTQLPAGCAHGEGRLMAG